MGKKRKVTPHPDRENQLRALARELRFTHPQTAALVQFFADSHSLRLTQTKYAKLVNVTQPTDDQERQLRLLFQSEHLTDAEEDALEAELMQQPVTITAPQPTDAAERAASWIQAPAEMLSELTDALNELLKLCHQCLYDGVLIQVKPEYRNVSYFGQIELVVVVFNFQWIRQTLVVRNAIENTPFQPVNIERLIELAYDGTGEEFHSAIIAYQDALGQLANWVHAKRILKGEFTPKPAEKMTITYPEFVRIYMDLVRDDITPTKKRIRAELKKRHGEHRTMASDLYQRYKNRLESGPTYPQITSSRRGPGPVR